MEKDSKKTVLVIGSKGMLGQELVSIFRKDGDFKVAAWDQKEIDITDKKQVLEKITKLKPVIILNAAAYNDVNKCEKYKKEFAKAKKINADAPGYLANVAKKIDAILVHYSTDFVFDGKPESVSWQTEPGGCTGSCGSCGLHQGFIPQIGFDENAIPNPIQKYGRTKFMGEKAVQKNGNKYYIIRLSKLFGRPAKGKDTKKSFFDIMLGLSKGKKVKVVDEEISFFTYAPDLAKKTKEVIESKKPFGIYHITNGEACTEYEAAVELYRTAKIKTEVIPISRKEFQRPAKQPYISSLINTKLNPLRSYKLALRDYLKK